MEENLNLDITLAMVASFQQLEKIYNNMQNVFSNNCIHLSAIKESRASQKELLEKIDKIIMKAEANPGLKPNNLSK